MEYIILDLEWNQPWPGSPSAKKKLPIHGEIIQIGAVKLENGQAGEEFQMLVRSHFYKKLNRKISSLTGIKEAKLKAEGVEFPEAMEQFRTWCGEDPLFFTWGYDDIPLLRENLAIYDMSLQWTDRWYNAQLIFNAQTDGVPTQRSLKTAMDMLEIVPTRPAHDALGDAYHTAKVLEKLDLDRGVALYAKTCQDFEDGFRGTELPGCLSRKVYHGVESKQKALAQMAGEENLCPECGRPMEAGRWYSQQGRRYMNLVKCPDHGTFLLRIRLTEESGSFRVIKLLYAGDSEAAKASRTLMQKARRHFHRKKRTPASPGKAHQ